MIVNRVNIESEEEALNIANINILVRFNKTREIFPSITQVLRLFLTDGSGLNSKEFVPKVLRSVPAASYAHRWALCSNNPANV